VTVSITCTSYEQYGHYTIVIKMREKKFKSAVHNAVTAPLKPLTLKLYTLAVLCQCRQNMTVNNTDFMLQNFTVSCIILYYNDTTVGA